MRLRAALRALGQNDDLPGVVDDIVTLTVQPADPSDPPQFFEVELRDIVRHHRRDALLNEELIADYLAEVAPVPFDRAFRSEEHTSELQSLLRISYAVFCLKKNITITKLHILNFITYTHTHTLIHVPTN